MWTYVKWTLRIVPLIVVALFLHYTLPQHDIVRISSTSNRLTEIGANRIFYASEDAGATSTASTRDIRFIDAVRPNGKVIVYRNEDTGWIWPPYFKYDSSNLQAEATNFVSNKTAPEWVSITHYGWRVPFLSIYPNAVAIKPVEGPDASIVPWVNIILLTALLILVLTIRRMWRRFRQRSIDPMLEDVGDAWEGIEDRADAAGGRARGFWRRLFGRA
ncbi:DUF1523 family protein [Phaeovulum sp. W22_SRMD_FR3]|uniref:DUF1523 family protein n=1 Tax=Phaeovulum sp. W22_SRMD_FR3 TaxID=3240274 RepID=UPI003F9DBEAA